MDRDTLTLESDYVPSVEGSNFHKAPHRFRYLIWGMRSGKSIAGAYELVRFALAKPGRRLWAIAPSIKQLNKVAWPAVKNLLNQWEGLVTGYNANQHVIRLVHGGVIEFDTADNIEGLRGPTVSDIWVDEGADIKREAWDLIRSRVSTDKGEIWITMTPKGRNWIWQELLKAGMPADAPYGEFSSGDRWVSHFPTEQFPWVSQSELEDIKANTPKAVFDREYGANFMSSAAQVFRDIEECMTHVKFKKGKATNIMGLDLAKFQDFTFVVIMDGGGRVLHLDRWNELNWTVAKPRIKQLAKDWNSIVALDRSNVGSVIEDDLRADDVRVFPIDLHDGRLKEKIVQGLQISLENHKIALPHPNAGWAGRNEEILYEELKTYAYSLTHSGRISYGAPRGLHDDGVMALALADHARMSGQVGGSEFAAEVMVPRENWRPTIRSPISATRKNMFSNVYGKRNSIGLQSGGFFWGR